jgi:hypothetical protein
VPVCDVAGCFVIFDSLSWGSEPENFDFSILFQGFFSQKENPA